METENTAPVVAAEPAAAATPAPAPAATPAAAAPVAAEGKPAAEPTGPVVVDVLASDLADMYPTLREMEEAAAKGLKVPVDKAWLDKQMADSRFKGFVHNMRKLANTGREEVASKEKAITADRAAIAQERERLAVDRTVLTGEVKKLQEFIDKLPKAPDVPEGGAPDPKSSDPRAQQWHMQAAFAKMIDPARQHVASLMQQEQQNDLEAKHQALVKHNEAFIAKTPDFHVYEADVAALLKSKTVNTIDAAYHHAKATRIAQTPATPVNASTGPDLSKMTPTEITLYALQHQGWKPPRDAKYRASS